ncbi:Os04g0461400 [Oryza sativa Japonica Group]|uniref:Os04g0461400 protein n=3 Tax=Oryza sativa TaxID=4530 RepID=Q0JCM7_ORYSJ|nr:hypothetical protein OsI_16177 [Oryza sativa Indica Group]BAF14910.1 Os04g0461400 [Oryza sativa Japonica Group]BAS89553.1 Os04g0461400 [Oryza sativa Japonica Group]|eukprot:NP_001052996.1 Os04g0461400 [Oryza sativa Japonica Group]
MLALILILCRLATRLSSSRVQPSSRLLSCCKWRRQARDSNCISCKKIGFMAIPMIFLQAVQLLSQACCLPLPELLDMKTESRNAESRFAKSSNINMLCIPIETCWVINSLVFF